ncbi:hypothetical protein CR513_29322, partial [Mucuna pruriens]
MPLRIHTNAEDANNFVGAAFQYIAFIAQVEGFSVLGTSMSSLLTPLTLILGSQQKIDSEAELSIKSFILTVTKPATSVLLSWFFVRQQPDLSALPSIDTIIFVAGGVLIFAYLATFGNLALEISVREGINGTEALKKATQIEFYTCLSFSILYSICKKIRGETTFQPQGSFKRFLLEGAALAWSLLEL